MDKLQICKARVLVCDRYVTRNLCVSVCMDNNMVFYISYEKSLASIILYI